MSLLPRLRRAVSPKRPRPIEPVPDTADALRAIERRLVLLQRDVDGLAARSATPLGPDRALTFLRSGEALLVDPRDRGCGLNLIAAGRYEEDEADVLRRFLRPGGVFLDVGANYGYHTMRAAPYLRPGGRAIAFEPNPHIHDLLGLSVGLNSLSDVVEAHRLAVSDRRATVDFAFDPEGPGGGRIVGAGEAGGGRLTRLSVPAVPLDDQLDPALVVDAVKIDVEGREEQVLRGMAGLVARSPRIAIVMEFIHDFLDEEQFRRLIGVVTDTLGLALHRVGPGGSVAPVDADALKGQACSLLLCRAGQADRAALVAAPQQFNLGPDAVVADGRIRWRRAGPPAGRSETVAFGPYLFLPRGAYRLRLAGRFAGSFICSLNDGGDRIREWRLTDDADVELAVVLDRDVRHLTLGFHGATRRDAAFELERAEFWAMG